MINEVKNVEKFKCGSDVDQRNHSIATSVGRVKISFNREKIEDIFIVNNGPVDKDRFVMEEGA